MMATMWRMWQGRPRLLPATTRAHLRNAIRENLLAMRSLLDVAIDVTERRTTRRRAAESKAAAPEGGEEA